MPAAPLETSGPLKPERENSAPTAAELETLIDRYTDNLMRAAFGLGFNESDAEELVQATFCAYFDGGSRFAKKSQLLTYLFGILYNKARETWRLKARTESLEAIEEVFSDHFDAEEHWNQESMDRMTEVEKKAQSKDVSARLQECLEGLSAAMRMAFTLKEVEGFPTEHICSVLDLNVNNLGVVLFRARNKLRECLMAKGVVIA